MLQDWRTSYEFAKLRPVMKHVVNHDLGQARAKQAAVAALNNYSEKFAKYSPKVDWTSENKAQIAFNVKGMSLAGALEVLDRTIELDLDVPFLLRPFKGQALQVIETEIKEWIEKARAGQV
jgi:hypothetical protein